MVAASAERSEPVSGLRGESGSWRSTISISPTRSPRRQGGAGAAGDGGGGGGAGLGGGLFVGPSAGVTVTNVSFKSNQAIGGVGGGFDQWRRRWRRRRRHVRKRKRTRRRPGGGGNGGYFQLNAIDSRAVWRRRRRPTAPATLRIGKDGGFGGGGGGGGGGIRTPNPPSLDMGDGAAATGIRILGGSGAGLGGAVFVQQGGSLTFGGTLDVSSNSAIGGPGQTRTPPDDQTRARRRRRPFPPGHWVLHFRSGRPGMTQTVADAIADQGGDPAGRSSRTAPAPSF